MQDGISDRRCTRDRRRLTQCLISIWSDRIIKFDKICLEFRCIEHGHQFIVQEISVQRPSCLLIENELLTDTIAHTHGYASMYLHLCKLRIQ